MVTNTKAALSFPSGFVFANTVYETSWWLFSPHRWFLVCCQMCQAEPSGSEKVLNFPRLGSICTALQASLALFRTAVNQTDCYSGGMAQPWTALMKKNILPPNTETRILVKASLWPLFTSFFQWKEFRLFPFWISAPSTVTRHLCKANHQLTPPLALCWVVRSMVLNNSTWEVLLRKYPAINFTQQEPPIKLALFKTLPDINHNKVYGFCTVGQKDWNACRMKKKGLLISYYFIINWLKEEAAILAALLWTT